MQTLTYLIAEMRELGIRSLALELSEPPSSLPTATTERETLAPGDLPPHDTDRPPKDAKLCAHGDCQEEAGGIFSGVARQYCRTHAMQAAGVKT